MFILFTHVLQSILIVLYTYQPFSQLIAVAVAVVVVFVVFVFAAFVYTVGLYIVYDKLSI